MQPHINGGEHILKSMAHSYQHRKVYYKGDCPSYPKHVVKYWGIPHSIINNRSLFTELFWTELFKLLGSNSNFPTSYHPWTNASIIKRMGKKRLSMHWWKDAWDNLWVPSSQIKQKLLARHNSPTSNQSQFKTGMSQQPLNLGTIATSYKGSN